MRCCHVGVCDWRRFMNRAGFYRGAGGGEIWDWVVWKIGGKDVSTAIPEVSTAAERQVYIRRSTAKRKDKGKAIMKEYESVQKKTKLQLEQERLRYEEALRLQAEERGRYSKADKARLLQLKKLSFDEIKDLFETTMKRVKDFIPMESGRSVPKIADGSSKRDADEELNQESSKR
ncbi:hypothetical protein Tco_0684010 [Tanacetum coccineum]